MTDLLNERREHVHHELALFDDETQVFESPTLFEMMPSGWTDTREPEREPRPAVEILAELPPYRLWLSSLGARKRAQEMRRRP